MVKPIGIELDTFMDHIESLSREVIRYEASLSRAASPPSRIVDFSRLPIEEHLFDALAELVDHLRDTSLAAVLRHLLFDERVIDRRLSRVFAVQRHAFGRGVGRS